MPRDAHLMDVLMWCMVTCICLAKIVPHFAVEVYSVSLWGMWEGDLWGGGAGFWHTSPGYLNFSVFVFTLYIRCPQPVCRLFFVAFCYVVDFF